MTVRSSRVTFEGTETTDTTTIRAGGAVDPSGQQQSRKIATSLDALWLRPFQAQPLAVWNPTAGADVTVTVRGAAYDIPANDELWMEISYLGDSSSTLATITNTTKVNLLASGVPVPADVGTGWADFACTLDGLVQNLIISNGGLTATRPAPGIDCSARSATARFGGKYYYEITYGLVTSNLSWTGLVVSTSTNNEIIVGNIKCAIAWHYSGEILSNDALSGYSVGPFDDGAIVCIAVDFDVEKIWFKNPVIHWNGKPLAISDPTVPATGMTVSVQVTSAPCIAFTAIAGGSVTANFGATSFVGAVPGGFTSLPSLTFDPATISGVTLSNGNLTVTHNGTAANAGAKVVPVLTTGKYYFEYTVDGYSDGCLFGFIPSGATYTQYLAGTHGVAYCTDDGRIFANGGYSLLRVARSQPGSVVGIAMDYDNDRVWVRHLEYWNGDPSHDPATNSGGISISSYRDFDMVPAVGFVLAGGSVGENVTFNFGATPYAYAPPGDVKKWGTLTPFKLEKVLSAPQPGQAGVIEARVCAGKAFKTYFIEPQIELTPAGGGTYNAATAHKSERYTYEGTETTETVITRVGGAAAPTGQQQSRKIITTANAQWLRPFQAEPYAIWNNITGADVTVTICGTVNSASLPNNDDIWLELEYLMTVAGTPAGETSYGNSGGSGNRTGLITITTTAAAGGGLVAELISGAIANAYYWSSGQTLRTVTFDFGSGASNIINEFTWYQNTAPAGGHGDWRFEGSNDDVSYTIFPETFTLGALVATQVVSITNATGYRYYRLRQISGVTTSTPWLQEITFKIGTTSVGALSCMGKLINTTKTNLLAANAAVTADSSTWNGGGSGAGWSPFKLTKTLSSPQPGQPGYIFVRPRVGKPNATFFLDPEINVS